VAVFVVHAGYAQNDSRNFASFTLDDTLSLQLGFGIRPGGLDRRLLSNRVSVVGGFMQDMSAGEDELLHLEVLKALEKPPGSLDRQLTVERAGRATEIIVGSEMNRTDEVSTFPCGELRQGSPDTFVVCEITMNEIEFFGPLVRAGYIESGRAIEARKRCNKRVPDQTFASGDEN
jgi:hypothetical protein